MSVSLNPSNSLGFNRPLTQLVKRTLQITNHNGQPVAFKVKTTAPKLYCVRPNSGRVEPGETVEVAVMLQAMKEEPPLASKCKDKFLIQSTIITPDKEALPLHDIWNVTEGTDEPKVHQQKLRVAYLPAEGQTLDEEDEGPVNQSSMMLNDSRFDTVPRHPLSNGHGADSLPDFMNDAHAVPRGLPSHAEEPERVPTPAGAFNLAREDSAPHDEPTGTIGVVNVTVHPPPRASPSPPPQPQQSQPYIQPQSQYVHPQAYAQQSQFVPPPRTPSPQPQPQEAAVDREVRAKYAEAQAEIERLRALLAAVPSSPPPTELRRRGRALSDDGESTIADTDVGTLLEDAPVHQDGVPLQVVVIIALGVFITTYLFF